MLCHLFWRIMSKPCPRPVLEAGKFSTALSVAAGWPNVVWTLDTVGCWVNEMVQLEHVNHVGLWIFQFHVIWPRVGLVMNTGNILGFFPADAINLGDGPSWTFIEMLRWHSLCWWCLLCWWLPWCAAVGKEKLWIFLDLACPLESYPSSRSWLVQSSCQGWDDHSS